MSDYKSKWCPFAQEMLPNCKGSYNRECGKSDEFTRCIGPDCMAYRVQAIHNLATGKGEGVGYCGLVGFP